MRIEIILGVLVGFVGIGIYELYNKRNKQIKKLKNDIETIDTVGMALMKELGEAITKCDELERRCRYLEADAKRLHFELTKEDSKWKINKENY